MFEGQRITVNETKKADAAVEAAQSGWRHVIETIHLEVTVAEAGKYGYIRETNASGDIIARILMTTLGTTKTYDFGESGYQLPVGSAIYFDTNATGTGYVHMIITGRTTKN